MSSPLYAYISGSQMLSSEVGSEVRKGPRLITSME